jgi:hypothetical protein
MVVSIPAPSDGCLAVRSIIGSCGLIWRGTVPLGRSPPRIDAGLVPELAGSRGRVDAGVPPPGGFVADAVHQPVVSAAEWDDEFIARFAAERSRLHERR